MMFSIVKGVKMSNNNRDITEADIEDMLGVSGEQPGGPTLSGNDLEAAFRTPNTQDTTRLLITPTNELHALLMRSHIPNAKVLLAMVGLYQKCKANNDTEGMAWVEGMLAGLPGVKAARAYLVSDTIIGEKHSAHRAEGAGMMQKIKSWWNG